MMIKTVILRNGTEVPQPIVITTMLNLKDLVESPDLESQLAFYELVMKCRDDNHKFYGDTGSVLERLALVQPGGGVHDSIRNIVLSAVEGNGLEMTLRSPIKQ